MRNQTHNWVGERGAEEMAQQGSALVVLVEEPGFVLTTHRVAHSLCNASSRVSDAFV